MHPKEVLVAKVLGGLNAPLPVLSAFFMPTCAVWCVP